MAPRSPPRAIPDARSTRPDAPARRGTPGFDSIDAVKERPAPRKVQVVLREGRGSDQEPVELPARGISPPVNSFGVLPDDDAGDSTATK